MIGHGISEVKRILHKLTQLRQNLKISFSASSHFKNSGHIGSHFLKNELIMTFLKVRGYFMKEISLKSEDPVVRHTVETENEW